MKNEQLLDAIGNIDDKLLIEAETKHSSRSRLTRRIFLAAAAVCALTVTVAATTGLFSRPIQDSEIVTDETVAPFSMDAEGNIIPQGVSGLKIIMDVDMNPDAPKVIEELYVLNPGEQWKWSGGGGASSEYMLYVTQNIWRQEGKAGDLRLEQSVAAYYTEGTYGEKCVDTLPGLTKYTGVTQQIVTIGGIQAVKVTIPALPDYTGTDYCTGGETRIYWTDGDYLLHLDYPHWMTDADAEALLSTLKKEVYVPPLPADYGRINPQSIADRLPDLSIGTENGTNCANNTMCLGYFAYDNGDIYCADSNGRIYRYNIATGESVECILTDEMAAPKQLFVTDRYILYTNKWMDLYALPKDGSNEEPVYQGILSSRVYAEGSTLYTPDAMLDLYTGEIQQWPVELLNYHVDEDFMYAITADDTYTVLKAPKGTMDFETIDVGVRPIQILAHGDDLYMAEMGTYEIIRFRDGKTTRLPVRALEYQILDGKLIYRDEDSRGTFLKSYDLETGEIETLCEKAFSFSVLNDQYICVFCAKGQERYYTIIDTLNGTTTRFEP